MELFAGKTPAERNKIIAAIVLGVLALIALYMAFGPSFRSKASPVAPSPSPSLTSSSPKRDNRDIRMPSQSEQDFINGSTDLPPINYNGGMASAPETGRNIFAFYEPPPQTPYVQTPTPIKTPSPTPEPPIKVAYIMPQTIYAGSGAFRMELNGDKFAPDTKVYFNQSQMPTSFVSAQKISAEVPAALIANEGPKTIIVQSLDGKRWSNQIILNVQAPPKPQFTYIGMIARKRYNNDTAYFQESGKQLPTSARLNDVVGGRFRLMSISADETVLEDVNLGFRYRLPLVKTPAASSGGPSVNPYGYPNGGGYVNPAYPQPPYPGMPGTGRPVYVSPNTNQKPQTDKKDTDKDVDDDDDTDN